MKKDAFESFFEDLFDGVQIGVQRVYHGYPRFNRHEDDDAYKVDVYYPGLKKEDFNVKVDKDLLIISSDFKDEKDDTKFHFKEFEKINFKRKFVLPEEVLKNKIKASYEDGVLKILIPKDKKKQKENSFDIQVE